MLVLCVCGLALLFASTFCTNGFVSRLIIDSDSLTITDVTESDAGVYTCIMNTTLDHDSASAELTIVGKFSLAVHFHS